MSVCVLVCDYTHVNLDVHICLYFRDKLGKHTNENYTETLCVLCFVCVHIVG